MATFLGTSAGTVRIVVYIAGRFRVNTTRCRRVITVTSNEGRVDAVFKAVR